MQQEKEFIVPIKADDFGEKTEIRNTDEKGRTKIYLLLSDKSVAEIREGKGTDAEKAAMESNGDQSKYMTSMMAATLKINGKPVNMYDVSDLCLKDYMAVQVAFTDINF